MLVKLTRRLFLGPMTEELRLNPCHHKALVTAIGPRVQSGNILMQNSVEPQGTDVRLASEKSLSPRQAE